MFGLNNKMKEGKDVVVIKILMRVGINDGCHEKGAPGWMKKQE